MEKEQIRKSKFLSLILRHDPGKAKINLDAHGWANVDDILKVPLLNIDMEELEDIVTDNDKKRFQFNADYSKIRAVQGHSIDVKIEMDDYTPINDLYHGTATKYVESIMKYGISKQKRQHVHLSKDYNTAVKVGARHGTPEVVVVDAISMLNDGIQFLQAANGVILTEYVAPQYLKPVFNSL